MTSRTRFEEWYKGWQTHCCGCKPDAEEAWQASEARLLAELNSPEMRKLIGAAICKAFQDNAVLWIEPAANDAIKAITTKLKGE